MHVASGTEHVVSFLPVVSFLIFRQMPLTLVPPPGWYLPKSSSVKTVSGKFQKKHGPLSSLSWCSVSIGPLPRTNLYGQRV